MNTTTAKTSPAPRAVTLNTDQRLYVIPCGDSGFSCWGFDNAFRDACALASLLGEPAPDESTRGTLALYNRARELERLYAARPDLNAQTWFTPGTSPIVRGVLESLRGTGRRVRLFLGDTATGRSWMEENDTCGTIGRSMGPQRVPLLICNSRDHGGGAILTDRIVRIVETATGRALYSHPLFHVPALTVKAGPVASHSFEVWQDGEDRPHARFATQAKAERWIAFMRGERNAA